MASPLATADQVRLRVQDAYRFTAETVIGDGSGSAFKLQQGKPYSYISAPASAHLFTANAAGTGWSATAATLDNSRGVLTFSGVISANTAVYLPYEWAVFSDDEIGHFTAVGGDVRGAALEAVRTLMADAYKRARWRAPDGSEYDDKQTMANLMMMYSALLDERTVEDGPQGGVESWVDSQELYD